MPTTGWALAGGKNEATANSLGSRFARRLPLQAKVLLLVPNAPQSSQDRLIPPPAVEPVTTNGALLVASPLEVVTWISEVPTPIGAVVSINVSEGTVNAAATDPNFTW